MIRPPRRRRLAPLLAPWFAVLLFAAPVSAGAEEPATDRPRRSMRPGGHPDRAKGVHEPLTEAEVIEALAILRDFKPELAERLAEVRERTPEATGSVLTRHVPWLRRMIYLRHHDPDRYQLQVRDLKLSRETRRLSEKLGEIDDPDQRRQLREKLKARVVEHFEVRQALRQSQIQAMRKRLEAFEQRLAEREAARDRLIAERLAEIDAGGDGAGEW